MKEFTPRDAIERIRNYEFYHAAQDLPYSERDARACLLAIGALERQAGKPPRNAEISAGRCAWSCPTCGTRYHAAEPTNYCARCGQKIEWRGNNNE